MTYGRAEAHSTGTWSLCDTSSSVQINEVY